MRVRLFVQREVAGVLRHPYETVDLDDATAQALIAAGSAVSLDPPRQAPAPAPSQAQPPAQPAPEEHPHV